jgi:hypothetical protein
LSERLDDDGRSGKAADPAPMRLLRPARALAVLAGVCLCAVLVVICARGVLLSTRASKVFRRFVADPVPSSVADIEVVQPKAAGGYGYVLRFGIDRVDFDQVRDSRPFREALIANDLDSGSIYWRWKGPPPSLDTQGFTFLGRGYEPSWYDLPSWENVETYALVQDDKDWDNPDIQILIYNPTLEQAYFIVYDYGGDAIWG